MNPLVSIITPTFNRAHIISAMLNSVLKQSYVNWECIIVDDGSTDNTSQILSEYIKKDNRIHYFQRPQERIKGAPTCRNIGLENAKGDYIIYLDSDDYLLSQCLQDRVEQFNKSADLDFLVVPMGIAFESGVKKKEIKRSDDYLIDFLSFNLPWSIMCPIWKRSFVQKINGYTEGYPRLNDPEFMIRALLVENVRYKVLCEAEYDTVYVPSKMEGTIYKDKYFESLKLFIPDICNELQKHKKEQFKPLLANYLHVWFKDFYEPLKISKTGQSKALLQLFYKSGVITSSVKRTLLINLYKYAFSNYFYREAKKQLTGRWFVK